MDIPGLIANLNQLDPGFVLCFLGFFSLVLSLTCYTFELDAVSAFILADVLEAPLAWNFSPSTVKWYRDRGVSLCVNVERAARGASSFFLQVRAQSSVVTVCRTISRPRCSFSVLQAYCETFTVLCDTCGSKHLRSRLHFPPGIFHGIWHSFTGQHIGRSTWSCTMPGLRLDSSRSFF